MNILEFLTAKKRGDNIWCDDRQISRYDKVDGAKQNSGLFIGTPDVLQKMRECELLSESEYFQKLDKLIESNYCFFVPDADYLFSRISVAKCDVSGRLIENKQLTAVRRAFAIALHTEFGLNVNTLQNTEYPEIAWYFLAASRMYGKCMLRIWGASKGGQWKFAASDWVLLALGDVFDGYSNCIPNYLNQWTLRLYLLSTSSIRIDEEYALQYSCWLNAYITTALVHNSALIDNVAAHISDLLTNTGK